MSLLFVPSVLELDAEVGPGSHHRSGDWSHSDTFVSGVLPHQEELRERGRNDLQMPERVGEAAVRRVPLCRSTRLTLWTLAGTSCSTGGRRRSSSSESWRTAGTARCVRSSGGPSPTAWPTTTVDWPLRRGNWWRRPTPTGSSVSSPAPPRWLQASTYLPAGESQITDDFSQ